MFHVLMVDKNLRYFLLILFLLFQGIIILVLFNKSIEIDGDIIPYLKIIGGDINIEYDIEPISLLIFKTIGLFPINFHFSILYLFIYLLCIIESWIVFKNTNGSILWIIFFTIVIVPFFHAINLRTGFGMFFLFLFYSSWWVLIITPLFHASFFPLLSGIRFKLSFKRVLIIIILSAVIGLIMFSLIAGKLVTYYGYYTDEESVTGVLIEILCLVLFSYFLKKKYQLQSSILWYRILVFVLLISIVSFRLAIISSRFVTITYLILLMIRLNSVEIKKITILTINNFFFYFLFVGLILFRLYRIVTMFGFITL